MMMVGMLACDEAKPKMRSKLATEAVMMMAVVVRRSSEVNGNGKEVNGNGNRGDGGENNL